MQRMRRMHLWITILAMSKINTGNIFVTFVSKLSEDQNSQSLMKRNMWCLLITMNKSMTKKARTKKAKSKKTSSKQMKWQREKYLSKTLMIQFLSKHYEDEDQDDQERIQMRENKVQKDGLIKKLRSSSKSIKSFSVGGIFLGKSQKRNFHTEI